MDRELVDRGGDAAHPVVLLFCEGRIVSLDFAEKLRDELEAVLRELGVRVSAGLPCGLQADVSSAEGSWLESPFPVLLAALVRRAGGRLRIGSEEIPRRWRLSVRRDEENACWEIVESPPLRGAA